MFLWFYTKKDVIDILKKVAKKLKEDIDGGASQVDAHYSKVINLAINETINELK